VAGLSANSAPVVILVGKGVINMSTYAQEMKKKYGVPYDVSRLRRAHGFKHGDKVEQDSTGEFILSGIPAGAEGVVIALPIGRGHSISSPGNHLIYVDWGRRGTIGVSWRALKKIK